MLDFHSKEIKSKVLNRFNESINKSTVDLSISLLNYETEVGSKLDLKELMNYHWF